MKDKRRIVLSKLSKANSLVTLMLKTTFNLQIIYLKGQFGYAKD
jgi:hypothetical protein